MSSLKPFQIFLFNFFCAVEFWFYCSFVEFESFCLKSEMKLLCSSKSDEKNELEIGRQQINNF